MNPWHDVDIGNNIPNEFSAVIEIPKGSNVKYELDKDTGLIRVDRILFGSINYPANYGFIPRTYCEDNDPLDVLVLGQEPVHPLSLMIARPIGLIKMSDQGEIDDKIIAVHIHDPEYCDYRSIHDLTNHRLDKLKKFFEDYKSLENKKVFVEDFLDAQPAMNCILSAIKSYKSKFK